MSRALMRARCRDAAPPEFRPEHALGVDRTARCWLLAPDASAAAGEPVGIRTGVV